MRNEALNAGTEAPPCEALAVASRYWLARHVHLCVTHGHVVMLDLQRDKYLAVASPHELAPWVVGWPVGPRPPAAAHDGSVNRNRAAASVIPTSLSRLLRDGLLTSDPTRGKAAVLATIQRPRASLVLPQFGIRSQVKPSYAAKVGQAWLTARIAQRLLSIRRLVERVQNRKARATLQPWDVQQARGLVTAFLWLRPLYYSPRDACLLDSLVLLELLAQHGLFPMWVYGVKLAPFAAHCWVQQDDIALNDTPEHTGRYTPLMCI